MSFGGVLSSSTIAARIWVLWMDAAFARGKASSRRLTGPFPSDAGSAEKSVGGEHFSAVGVLTGAIRLATVLRVPT